MKLKQNKNLRAPRLGDQKKSPGYSYYSSELPKSKAAVRAREKSGEKRKLAKNLRLIPSVIASMAIGLSVVYSTTLSTSAGINFVGEPALYRTTEDYEKQVAEILGTSLWYKNKLTIDTEKIEKKVQESLPEVARSKLTLPVIGRQPTLTMQVRVPALLLVTPTNSFVVDSGGIVVAETKRLTSSALESLLTVQDQGGLEITVGAQALTSNTVAFIKAYQAQLSAKQLTISAVTVPAVPNQIDFKIKDINYYIKTDSTGDARIQAGDFIAVKESGVVPSEYMDVRVEEKVFYK